MTTTYQFSYSADGTYGRAMGLLREFAGKEGVVLDLGCGFGAIAEPVRELGLTYAGADADPDGLADLAKRGFEGHLVDLREPQKLAAGLTEILAGRKLAAISMLDVLEHTPDNLGVLKILRELTEGLAVPLIISVPNVSHRDVAFKLLTGRWQYTDSGLLDRTHIVHHTEPMLEALAKSSGWRAAGKSDLCLEQSDQHFPEGSVVLSPHTELNHFLRSVREGSDQNGSVNQFIRAYLPAQEKPVPVLATREEPERPFLSVVMRTQGRRPATLRDTLLCLAGQDCGDFEVQIIAHKVNRAQQYTVERIVEDLPADLRKRTKITRVDHGNRTTPLNIGFLLARGHYISVLDDDDVVLAHWVKTFKDLAQSANGKVLRSVAVEQEIEERVWHDGSTGYLTVSGLRRPYPSEYDLYDHLTQNYTPPMCLSFPSALFHELGLRFDEELDTCEDWDLEMRAVLLCGIAASPEYTAIYRKWKTGHASYTVHSREVWAADHQRITDRLNEQAHVFPPGTVKRIVDLNSRIRELERQVADLRGDTSFFDTPPAPDSADFPLRYKVADRINVAIKRTPMHALFKKVLKRGKS